MSDIIYLDWNATTPPLPQVLETMARVSAEHWGNPSSVHALGRHARRLVEEAREKVAALTGTLARDVVLTSGGTEANNMALRSLCADASVLITSALEHPSVIAAVRALHSAGLPVRWLPVDATGAVSAQALEEALREEREPSRAVVAVQAVNHITGVVQPVRELLNVAHAVGARVHVDAVQAAGKLDPSHWHGADCMAIAAHKFRGPKGIGAVCTSGCVQLLPLLDGGGQERGLRPGTQSPSLAAGMAVAADWAMSGPARYDSLRPLRDRLESALRAQGAHVNGSAARVPHVTNLSWPGLRGDELVVALDCEGVCVSAGSACSAGTQEASSVIAAMAGPGAAQASIRLSLGETTTAEEIDEVIARMMRVLERARAMDEVLLEARGEAAGAA